MGGEGDKEGGDWERKGREGEREVREGGGGERERGRGKREQASTEIDAPDAERQYRHLLSLSCSEGNKQLFV